MSLARVVSLFAALCICTGTTAGPAEARKGKRSDAAHADKRSPLALQVALDRVRFSPGPIDGRLGGNTKRAIKAFQRAHGMKETGNPDRAVWERLGAEEDSAPLVPYVITDKDVAGPFEPKIPESMEEKAKLLAYTGPDEPWPKNSTWTSACSNA